MKICLTFLCGLFFAMILSFASRASEFRCSEFFIDSNSFVQSLPVIGKSYRLEYTSGSPSLDVVHSNGVREDLMLVWSQNSFPGSYGVLPNNDFVIGTTTAIYRYTVKNNKAELVFGYGIFSRPTFASWSFSENGRYAVGIYKVSSTEDYLQIFVFDSQSTRSAKGSSYGILNVSTDPVRSLSISDTGEVTALSLKGKVLELEQ